MNAEWCIHYRDEGIDRGDEASADIIDKRGGEDHGSQEIPISSVAGGAGAGERYRDRERSGRQRNACDKRCSEIRSGESRHRGPGKAQPEEEPLLGRFIIEPVQKQFFAGAVILGTIVKNFIEERFPKKEIIRCAGGSILAKHGFHAERSPQPYIQPWQRLAEERRNRKFLCEKFFYEKRFAEKFPGFEERSIIEAENRGIKGHCKAGI